jgi:hypothetical protein
LETLLHSWCAAYGKLVRQPGIAPGPCHYNKEQTPLGQLALPTRGFTAAVSVFGGTPPTKPLICKIQFEHSGGAASHAWAHNTGAEPKLVLARFSFAPEDIIKMSGCSYSQSVDLSLLLFIVSRAGKIKNPASIPVSRVREIWSSSFTCLPPVYPNWLRVFARDTPRIGQG